jgi:hypothetical protein
VDDLDQEGHWKFLVKTLFPNRTWKSTIIKEFVHENLAEPA